MARYIDADILLDRLEKVEAVGINMDLLKKLVNGEETVDVKKIATQCQDCFYWERKPRPWHRPHEGFCRNAIMDTEEDFYCAWARRKGVENAVD